MKKNFRNLDFVFYGALLDTEKKFLKEIKNKDIAISGL